MRKILVLSLFSALFSYESIAQIAEANFVYADAEVTCQNIVKVPSDLKRSLDAQDAKTRSQMRTPRLDQVRYMKETRPIWNDESLSLEKKIELTYEKYVELVMPTASESAQATAKHALANLVRKDPMRSGYSWKTGLVDLGRKLDQHPITKYMTLVHELEHIFQFDRESEYVVYERSKKEMQESGNEMPNAPLSLQQAEFEAIGTQWDFLQAIPDEIILIERTKIIKSHTFVQILERTLLGDLKVADLSRMEYVRIQADEHHYSIYVRTMKP